MHGQTLERPMERARQRGVSIVEVAITLVVIGLLLGFVVTGMALTTSAKVSRVVATSVDLQAAFLAFVDRYRRIPGDWNAADAQLALGQPVTGGGNGNGIIDNVPGPALYDEVNAAWEQLSDAGLIKGSYLGLPATEPTVDNGLAPTNPFQTVMVIGRTMDYEGVNPVQLHLVVGRGMPVAVVRELDVKLDDGHPGTGSVRATLPDGAVTVFGTGRAWGGREASCVSGGPLPAWNAAGKAQDCNAVLLF